MMNIIFIVQILFFAELTVTSLIIHQFRYYQRRFLALPVYLRKSCASPSIFSRGLPQSSAAGLARPDDAAHPFPRSEAEPPSEENKKENANGQASLTALQLGKARKPRHIL